MPNVEVTQHANLARAVAHWLGIEFTQVEICGGDSEDCLELAELLTQMYRQMGGPAHPRHNAEWRLVVALDAPFCERYEPGFEEVLGMYARTNKRGQYQMVSNTRATFIAID